MVSCPECFHDVAPLSSTAFGVGRVGWWCDNCNAIYPDDDYVEMRDRPLGMPY